MPTKYILVSFRFDTEKWSRTIARIERADRPTFALYIGVNENTLRTWANLKRHQEFPFPSMSAFIATCNAFDLNPSDFFVLNTPEDKNV